MEPALATHSFSQTVASKSNSLLITLLGASVIHIFIVLEINFTIPNLEKINKSIEITLSSSATKKVPKTAKYLAQDNQLGAGQKTPRQGDSKKNQPVQRKSAKKPTPPATKPRPKLTTQSLQKQIARLGSEIRYSKQSAEQTKIKSIHSVSIHKLIGAQYQKDWAQKIERIGALNYPEVARKKGFTGTLTMDVGISADGSIYAMSIVKSSGIKALDNAAKHIVKLGAPFPALPKKLLEELEVLVIRKTWTFSDESGMTTR